MPRAALSCRKGVSPRVCGTTELPPVIPPYADPAGVAVLRKVNRQLEGPLGSGSLHLLTSPDHERAAMPVVRTTALDPLVERWESTLASLGHDVRGSLAILTETGDATDLPGPRDQLGVAVDALADALAEKTRLRTLVASLEADRDRLDRKRRKWKTRAQKGSGNSG